MDGLVETPVRECGIGNLPGRRRPFTSRMTANHPRPTQWRLALAAILLTVFARVPLHAQEASRLVRRVDAAHEGALLDSVRAAPRPVQKTFFVRRDLVYSGIALVGTAAVSHFDRRVARWSQGDRIQGDSGRQDLVSGLTRINETPLTIAAAATWGVGRLVRSQTAADVGLHTFEALLLTTSVSEVIRGTLGRTRPRSAPDEPFDFQPGTGFTKFETRSFPSLHTAAAFATASALVGEIRLRRPAANAYAAPLLYTAAVVPGLTRIYLDQHWASDIAAGAFVGVLLGSRLVGYAHSHDPNKLDRRLLGVSAMPDGAGRVMVVVTARP
jgi:membrane-associated phospholipid phosphatase